MKCDKCGKAFTANELRDLEPVVLAGDRAARVYVGYRDVESWLPAAICPGCVVEALAAHVGMRLVVTPPNV